MANAHPRIVQLMHSSPGRTRLRLAWLRHAPGEAESLADRLAELDESVEVRARPWTGSVLVSYDPERLDEERILGAVRRHTRVAAVTRRGERSVAAQAEVERAARAGGSTLARTMRRSMGEINRDVLQASDGRLDLGSLAGLSFLAIGAAEIALTRKLPAPPWFNLAWYAFRTFTIFSTEESEEDGAGGEGAGAVADTAADALADAGDAE
jgi:hypothetical protein